MSSIQGSVVWRDTVTSPDNGDPDSEASVGDPLTLLADRSMWTVFEHVTLQADSFDIDAAQTSGTTEYEDISDTVSLDLTGSGVAAGSVTALCCAVLIVAGDAGTYADARIYAEGQGTGGMGAEDYYSDHIHIPVGEYPVAITASLGALQRDTYLLTLQARNNPDEPCDDITGQGSAPITLVIVSRPTEP